MTLYVAELLNLSPDAASSLRKTHREKYGSTLQGLLEEDHLDDPQDFLDRVHPKCISQYLEQDGQLAEVLSRIRIPKSILTNSIAEHAQRVLCHFGVERLFGAVFDIRFNDYRGKPHRSLYLKVLAAIAAKPEQVLFVDDMPDYLHSFRELGGSVVLVRENGGESWHEDGMPSIRSIADLPDLLESAKL